MSGCGIKWDEEISEFNLAKSKVVVINITKLVGGKKPVSMS